MPTGAVYVGRPTKWGNPYTVREYGRAQAVAGFRDELETYGAVLTIWYEDHSALMGISPDVIREELRGRDLACWCPLDQPCHADVLLEVANRD